ncbi:hypothetical protein Acr_24g0003440 [Actinidia rufa]|uniref:Uncharacterized protein n=1 Tax=Actinidia rufa TaxID=165716 RepID=A0A7J0GUD4_9ERIC|nr:hypothetical protein Acr_24g0003440 [Actinidia rufa]
MEKERGGEIEVREGNYGGGILTIGNAADATERNWTEVELVHMRVRKWEERERRLDSLEWTEVGWRS